MIRVIIRDLITLIKDNLSVSQAVYILNIGGVILVSAFVLMNGDNHTPAGAVVGLIMLGAAMNNVSLIILLATIKLLARIFGVKETPRLSEAIGAMSLSFGLLLLASFPACLLSSL